MRPRPRARRRSWPRHSARLLAGVLALVCAAAFAAALAAPAFDLREVTVVGASRLDRDALRDASGLLGANALRASAGAASSRLRELPAVRDARVSVMLPDRARIEVDERVPAAVIVAGGARLLADDSGALFPGGGAEGLPMLEDETAPRAAGERVDSALVAAARKIAALQPAFFGRRIERLRLTTTLGLVLILERGTEVRLGTADRLDLKLDAARRIVLARAGKRLDYVDVRSLEGIAYFPTD